MDDSEALGRECERQGKDEDKRGYETS
jgi:hypothetical protein